jgi:bifunctional DNase/RNase
MLIEMKVASLTVDPFTSMPIVILKDVEGRHSVPIWIGMIEASAIATELDKIELDRPMTHDLMASILKRTSIKVERIEVTDLRDHTFYATLYLRDAAGTEIKLDARPSDAIALALRTGASIHVASKVIERAKRIDLRLDPEPPNLRRDALPAEGTGPMPPPNRPGRSAIDHEDPAYAAILESLGEGAFGKWKM